MPADAFSASFGTGAGAAFECDDLTIRYGSVVAVDGLSLHAGAGEVLALLGPNGAGKTSTVECLEGYRRPSTGTVTVLGRDPVSQRRELTPRIGVMLQSGGVYPMLSPARMLRLFAAYYPDPEAPEDLLALVGLSAVAATPWRHLSGGEQQRLSLALALVGRPDVVFLDEPTAGVDPEGRIAIREVVGTLRARGCGILLCTHEMQEAERLADRIIVIHRGRAAASGTLAELAAAPVVTFGAPPGLEVGALGEAIGARVIETAAGRYEIAARPSPALTAALTAWLAEQNAALSDLRTARTLEEIYLGIVGDAALGDPVSGERDQPRRRSRRS
jgi:ABC-2 type transport system ATP-binding protein